MSRSSRSFKGGTSGRMGGVSGVGGAERESHLDGLNSSLTEGLVSKLGQLKGLALDLEGEAKDHLPLLDLVDDDMEEGGMRMSGSSGRLRGMGRTRGMSTRKLSCYVGVGVAGLLLLVYYFLIPLSSSRPT